MNQVEKLLKTGLDGDPSDWSVRLELAAKLAERNAGDEFEQLLREAPVPPADESQVHRLVELANHCERWDALKQVLAIFSATQPNSAWARLAYAQTLNHTGDATTALVHYREARKLDGSLSDPSLDTLLAEQEQKAAAAAVKAEEEAPAADVMIVEEEEVAEEITPVVPAARSLRPPGSEEKVDEPAVAEVSPVEAADPVSEVVTGDAELDLDLTKAHVVNSEDFDDLDFEFDHEVHRSFIVGDGEMVHAHEKDPDAKEKVSAIAVAVLIHVGLAILLGLVGLAMPRPKPPQITASAVANVNSDQLQQEEIKKIKRSPVQTASAQMQVTTVTASSAVSMPEINTTLTTFDPVGAGDNFGTSMSFDMGEDGGMVSFFGAKSVSKKVVFVVDFSASMGGDKDKLMRKELAKSIEALPNGVQYQLVLFSGPAWYAGWETAKSKKVDKHVAHVVKNGRDEYVWYEGWDEGQRHEGNKRTALYHYGEGQDKLPEGEYITATRSNIRKTLKAIQDTPLSFGTDWRWPLRMAMNLEPDTIFFMTDGAFGTSKGVSKTAMIDELLDYNRSKGKATINTICMMVLNARTELEQLAENTRGEFTLVLQDGTVVRGKELDKVGKGKGKGK